MSKDKQKLKNRLRQQKLRAKRQASGWKKMWIPPKLVRAVKEMISEEKQ